MSWDWRHHSGWVALGLSAAVLGLSFSFDILLGQGGPVDWTTYANAADRFLAGLPLYSSGQLAGPYQLGDTLGSNYLYPPPSVLLFLAHGSLPYGYVAWATLNVALLVTGLAAVLRRELGTALPWPLAIVLFALAAFPPFRFGVGTGNVSVGLAGLYAWTWANSGRWIGPVSGAAAVLKLYPGILVLWRVRQVSSWRPLFVAMGVAGGIVLLTLPVVGLDRWHDFAMAGLNARPTCQSSVPSAICLAAGLPGPLPRLVPWAITGLFALGALRLRSPIVAFACLGAAMLAPLMDMTDYYFLVPFVFVVIMLAHAYARRAARRAASTDEPPADARGKVTNGAMADRPRQEAT